MNTNQPYKRFPPPTAVKNKNEIPYEKIATSDFRGKRTSKMVSKENSLY